MFILVNEFLHDLNPIISQIKQYPFITDYFAYDKRFTPEWFVEAIRSDEDSGGYWYQYLFDEVDHNFDNEKYVSYVADSEDVDNDNFGYTYSYYYGLLGNELNAKSVPFIYAMPCYDMECPARLTIYGFDTQIELLSTSPYVDIYETNIDVYKMFYIKNKEERLKSIIEFLKSTDRTNTGFIQT